MSYVVILRTNTGINFHLRFVNQYRGIIVPSKWVGHDIGKHYEVIVVYQLETNPQFRLKNPVNPIHRGHYGRKHSFGCSTVVNAVFTGGGNRCPEGLDRATGALRPKGLVRLRRQRLPSGRGVAGIQFAKRFTLRSQRRAVLITSGNFGISVIRRIYEPTLVWAQNLSTQAFVRNLQSNGD